MPHINPTYHYDYRALDALLKEGIPPESCSKHLDEALHVLVCCLGKIGAPPAEQIASLYSDLRELRDVFENIKPAYAQASADKPAS